MTHVSHTKVDMGAHSDLLTGFVEAGTQAYRWTHTSRQEKAKTQTFTSDPKVIG